MEVMNDTIIYTILITAAIVVLLVVALRMISGGLG